MNRLSSFYIVAACLALGSVGCFAQAGSDEDGQSGENRGRGARIVSAGGTGTTGSTGPETVLFNSRIPPGGESMGPEPDPWKGRAQGGDTGGPEPDPWNQNGDGRKPNPNPNPYPTHVSVGGDTNNH